MITDHFNPEEIQWSFLPFDELSPAQLYAILRLRSEVFIVEQQCIFLDMDNKDQHCWHLSAWKHGKLLAYTRIVPKGISYTEASIGRVVTAPDERGSGIGKLLMEKSIMLLHNKYGKIPIKIGAQCYLKKFYMSLGFEISGDTYLEDGIEHVEMLLKQR